MQYNKPPLAFMGNKKNMLKHIKQVLQDMQGDGLAHIIDKRKSEFIKQGLSEIEADKAIKSLLDTIPHILDKGRIYRQNADKIEIITDKYTLVVGLRNDRKLIITELVDRRNKKRLEAMQTGVGDSFTDEPLT